MKEKACAEQLRSLSDRDNPSQEHAQTPGKVKRQYKTHVSQGTWGTCSRSCEHWSHCVSVTNRSSIWPSLEDTPFTTSGCSPSTSPCTQQPASQAHGQLLAPTSILQQLGCTLLPATQEILSEMILLQEHWRGFTVTGSNSHFKYTMPEPNEALKVFIFSPFITLPTCKKKSLILPASISPGFSTEFSIMIKAFHLES